MCAWVGRLLCMVVAYVSADSSCLTGYSQRGLTGLRCYVLLHLIWQRRAIKFYVVTGRTLTFITRITVTDTLGKAISICKMLIHYQRMI